MSEDIWSKDRPLNLKKISDFFNDVRFSQDDLNNKVALRKLCNELVPEVNTGNLSVRSVQGEGADTDAIAKANKGLTQPNIYPVTPDNTKINYQRQAQGTGE